MRRLIAVALLLAVLTLAGCGHAALYGGTDGGGNSAEDVVREYYSNFQEHEKGLELVTLSHCKAVSEKTIGESDRQWAERVAGDDYAYCFVQTADSVKCLENCATGMKDETVARCLVYLLSRDRKDSPWRICEYGYPPIYVP